MTASRLRAVPDLEETAIEWADSAAAAARALSSSLREGDNMTQLRQAAIAAARASLAATEALIELLEAEERP